MSVSMYIALLFLILGTFAHADEEADISDEIEVDAHPGFTDEEWNAVKDSEESFEFEAEVSRLMDIIINALYSNRDVFLRELISNAADALDKIRYQSVTDSALLGEGDEANLEIQISFDKEAKTLTIRDRGVGMTKAELIKNLGIVAKSGTTEFVEAATGGDGDALSLIGQFGVGFYSVYLVADKVVVASKANGDEQYLWESKADRTFSVALDPRGNTLGRGTSITLHIKEDAEEYLNENQLKKIVARYSEFVNFPIYLSVETEVEEEVPLTEEELAEQQAAKDAKDEDEEEEDLDVSEEEDVEEEELPTTKTIKKKVNEWERLNEMKAIWTRRSSEVSEEEYSGFYKALTKDTEEPLGKVHFAAEGEISFRSLLYIPKTAPQGMYDNYYSKATGVRLYVRRVLISDEFEDFLPKYLGFIKGVVDSEDLPINVSRETLAQSRVLKVMSKKLVRKVLEMLRKLSEAEEEYLDAKEEAEEEDEEADEDDTEESEEDEDDEDTPITSYSEFWAQFAKSIKLGVIEDKANKSKLSKLLRFPSNLSPDTPISLERYVAGMQEDQRDIYYISGESLEAVQSSPMLERLEALDYEVLFFIDPLDEYITQSLTEFEGNNLQSITKAGLKLGDEETVEAYAEKFEGFTTWLKDVYGDKVTDVAVSPRLATTPAIIVTGQYGWTANMERIMKAQTFSDAQQQTWMHAKKTLEINPKNAMIRELQVRSAADPDSQELKDYAELIFDAALVQSGFTMADSKDFAERIHRLVGGAIDVDPTSIVEVDLAEPASTEDEEEEDVEVVLD